MANEKRLVDANAFWNLLQQVVYDTFTEHEHDGKLTGTGSVGYYSETIEKVLKQTPTVDAVEVVRCKECSFWTYEGVGSSTLKRFGRCAKWYPYGDEQHNCHDDDFCSYGERRTDG